MVKGPAQGGVAVTVTFDSTSIEAPGMGSGAMGPALDRMRGMKSDVVYDERDRKSTRLNSSHSQISYAVFCLKKKKRKENGPDNDRAVYTRGGGYTHADCSSATS